VHLVLSGTPLDRALSDLPPEARAITNALRDAGRLRTGDVEELLGRSRPVALRRLRALEAEGIVRWVGQSARDPQAHWELAR
jgi:ATP-dependent DNA helicase RecG